MFEAILLVCLTTPLNTWAGDRDVGPTCVRMNIASAAPFHTNGQCEFWLEQAKAEVQSPHHFEKIKQKLPNPQGSQYTIKGKCINEVFNEFFICPDCEL